MDALNDVVRHGLIVVAVLCFPVLALTAAIGLAVAVVQAATQVQEQTLTLLPKMLAVGIVVAVLGPFAMQLCIALLNDAVAAIPALVAGGA